MSEPSQASRAARHGALIVEEPQRGTLVVTGPERVTWLNGLVTCDVAALSPGRGAWGLLLTKQGKVQSDVLVVPAEEALYLAVAGDRAAQLFETLDRFLIMEDAELFERSSEHVWISLHGPRAFELARAVVPAGGSVAEVDPTGLGGAAAVVPRVDREATLDALMSAPGFDVARAGPSDWAELRIERGVPVFGVDYTPDDNPHEASLDRKAVSWTKGCYLGQEVVCMQDMRGRVKRRLVTLSLAGGAVPEPGTPVNAGSESIEVGRVTSAATSSRLGRPIAMARVLTKLPEPCGTFSVAGHPAELLAEPA